MRRARSQGIRKTAALVLLLLTAACSRPTGDFGRATPSYLHDEALPAVGAALARARQGQASSFLLTEAEEELRTRSFAFTRAPHLDDWWFDRFAEAERVRLVSPSIRRLDAGRYYDFIKSNRFASTKGRYAKILEDMGSDLSLMPQACAAAAQVRQLDRQRLSLVRSYRPAQRTLHSDVEARIFENQRAIALLDWAFRYRIVSYAYAIEQLAVEAPSSESATAEIRFNRMQALAEKCALLENP